MIKYVVIYLLLISLTWANTPQTLIGQKKISNNEDHHLYRYVNDSDIAYIYGPEGDQIVYVNFNYLGTLISKTTYGSSNKKKNFIYNDDCKKRDCHQFIH